MRVALIKVVSARLNFYLLYSLKRRISNSFRKGNVRSSCWSTSQVAKYGRVGVFYWSQRLSFLPSLLARSLVTRGTEPRHGASPYRHPEPEIQLLDEQAVQRISPLQQYQDIRQTLGLPFVNSDYQALAK